MTFPTTGVLDSFSRANENPLSDGGKWSSPFISGDTALKIVSNQAVQQGGATSSDGYWNVQNYGPDCEVFVDIMATPVEPVIACRLSAEGSATPFGYLGYFVQSGGFYQITVLKTGGNSTLTSGAGTLLSGDSFGMSAIGNLITLYRKTGGVWSSVLSVTDSTITTAGHIGLYAFQGADAYQNFGGGTAGDAFSESLQYQLQ